MLMDDAWLWDDDDDGPTAAAPADDGTPDAPLAALLDFGLKPDVFRRLAAAGARTVRDAWDARAMELRGAIAATDRTAVNAALNLRTWRSLGCPNWTPGKIVVVERLDGTIDHDPELSPETLATLLAAPIPPPAVGPDVFREIARREQESREMARVADAKRRMSRRGKAATGGSLTLFD